MESNIKGVVGQIQKLKHQIIWILATRSLHLKLGRDRILDSQAQWQSSMAKKKKIKKERKICVVNSERANSFTFFSLPFMSSECA